MPETPRLKAVLRTPHSELRAPHSPNSPTSTNSLDSAFVAAIACSGNLYPAYAPVDIGPQAVSHEIEQQSQDIDPCDTWNHRIWNHRLQAHNGLGLVRLLLLHRCDDNNYRLW